MLLTNASEALGERSTGDGFVHQLWEAAVLLCPLRHHFFLFAAISATWLSFRARPTASANAAVIEIADELVEMANAEWWRGRTDRREAVLPGLLVEPASDEVMKLAGVALGKVPGAITIDAIVAAFAVQRTGIVYTGDVTDFEALRGFFPALRVFGIRSTGSGDRGLRAVARWPP